MHLKKCEFYTRLPQYWKNKTGCRNRKWAELTSTFLNKKAYLQLLIEIKKQTYRHVRTQRNHRQFIITYNQLLDQLIEKSR